MSRALVISDIHGNWPALRSVIETSVAQACDFVIVLGDLVGYGPFPAECVTWVRENADVVVQGNHDRAYAENISPRCSAAFRWLSDAVGPLTRRSLDNAQREYLDALPRWAMSTIDGRKYAFVHAAPSDPLYRYIGPRKRAWERESAGLDAETLLVGHTHLQFALTLPTCDVVNPGSVGQPKDGDPRAAFLVVDDGSYRFERVAYPIEETTSALRAAGVAPDASAALAQLLRTGVASPQAVGLPSNSES